MNEDIINPADLEAPATETVFVDGETFRMGHTMFMADEVDYALPSFTGQVVNHEPPMPDSVIAAGQLVSASTYPSLTAINTGSHMHSIDSAWGASTTSTRSRTGRPLTGEAAAEEQWSLYQEARRTGQLEVAERLINTIHYNLVNPF